ncbi:IDEAL domain protein [compost metagenome]
MDKQNMIKTKLSKVCESKVLIDHLIFDASINLLIIEEQKKSLMRKIDQSLIDKNENDFKRLTTEYRELFK